MGGVGTSGDPAQASKCEGLTLIMACRSESRACAARKQLYRLLDEHVEKQRKMKEYDGHADTFRKNVKIEVHHLDLANMQTILRFADEMHERCVAQYESTNCTLDTPTRYPYISHLICNAGVASFTKIDWPACFAQLARAPIAALTTPEFYRQRSGEISADGLGWVWQCNVFGHYALVRTFRLVFFYIDKPLFM
jgi:3-keto steroid reductase